MQATASLILIDLSLMCLVALFLSLWTTPGVLSLDGLVTSFKLECGEGIVNLTINGDILRLIWEYETSGRLYINHTKFQLTFNNLSYGVVSTIYGSYVFYYHAYNSSFKVRLRRSP